MSENLHALLDEVARQRGLGEAYYDHQGQLFYFSRETRVAILAAMRVRVDDEASLREALSSNSESSAAARETGQCYQPEWLSSRRCFGISMQLYSLRSRRNWGIGDFADLKEVIELTAPLGCDVVGLNPLHALFPADPAHCSPYSPSSRLFLNVLYIAIDAVPGFANCAALQSLCAQESFQAALTAVRNTDVVMYEQVASLKFCALRLLYAHFLETDIADNTERAQAFRNFESAGGKALRLHAVFDALDEHFRSDVRGGWRHWPAEYQDPESQAVRDFTIESEYEVAFYTFLQWLADDQLASAQRLAREQGMHVGLYGDLAVGANPDGSEIWSNQSLYVSGASVGAPPDPLALNGQDWGIPPVDPHALKRQQFAPFIELLRANLRHVGALRIDHVMSLFRLWWVPHGFSAIEGVYVHYPLQELVEILIRESNRARCLIIGEDLGTVPDEMRSAMEAHRIYHYKVLLFEKSGDRFKLPGEYVRYAVATATTHDLPLLKAWWSGEDLTLRDQLGLYPSPDTIHRLRDERTADRYALLRALRAADLWHWFEHEPLPGYSPALARAIHLFLAETQSALAFVQIEDLIGMTEPVNVPGTHVDYPNWQRKVRLATHDIFKRSDVIEPFEALGKARTGVDPNR